MNYVCCLVVCMQDIDVHAVFDAGINRADLLKGVCECVFVCHNCLCEEVQIMISQRVFKHTHTHSLSHTHTHMLDCTVNIMKYSHKEDVSVINRTTHPSILHNHVY